MGNLTLAILLEHMHKKFVINRTKIKGGCQSGRKVVNHNSKSDLPLIQLIICKEKNIATIHVHQTSQAFSLQKLCKLTLYL